MIRARSWQSTLFDVFNLGFLALLGLLCLLPLIHTFAVSLSSKGPSMAGLVSFWPVGFTTYNYEHLLVASQFQRSFVISLVRVLAGTALTLLVVVLTAYPLSLAEGFPGQRVFKWILIFAMLFSGGLIPWFLAIRSLGLYDTMGALVLPGVVQMFSIIIMLNFFRQLPQEMVEAAAIDGASHWNILFRIYLPLSLPCLATLGLFSAVGHWNAWFDGMVLMKRVANYPLQTYLQTVVIGRSFAEIISMVDTRELAEKLSTRSLQAAMIIVAMIPILMLYPFLQRYFLTGLTLGSVKG